MVAGVSAGEPGGAPDGQPPETAGAYVHEGMTVLEPGPGMGFLTVELARLVGASGRVVALDIQSKMLEGLKRRLAKAGLLERVDIRLVQPHSMQLDDLAGSVDFALAFAVVHEMPSASSFWPADCYTRWAWCFMRGKKSRTTTPFGMASL
jgi:SAM-dependent methyltransferase